MLGWLLNLGFAASGTEAAPAVVETGGGSGRVRYYTPREEIKKPRWSLSEEEELRRLLIKKIRREEQKRLHEIKLETDSLESQKIFMREAKIEALSFEAAQIRAGLIEMQLAAIRFKQEIEEEELMVNVMAVLLAR